MRLDPSTSFGEETAQYSRFRPDYAKFIFDFLAANLSGNRALAIELGAGSGQATHAIAELFERVIAIEPDARLIEEANFPLNVEAWVSAAEDADLESGSVDAVVAATAFHWMDQSAICKNVARWLSQGGVFFPFAYDVFRFEGRVQEFFAKEFEKWRPYRDKRLDDNYDYPAILERSGVFSSVTALRCEMQVELNVHDAAGLICSASYAAAYARAKSSPSEYFSNVQNALGAAGEPIKVIFPVIGAIGRVP